MRNARLLSCLIMEPACHLSYTHTHTHIHTMLLLSSPFFSFLLLSSFLLLLLLLFGLYKYIKGDTGECGACQRDSCHQRRNCHCLYCLSVSQALIYIIQDIIDRPIRQAPILFLPLLLYVYIFIFLILLFSLGDFFVLFFLFFSILPPPFLSRF